MFFLGGAKLFSVQGAFLLAVYSSPYIPFALCDSCPKRLVIVIKWEKENENYHNSIY